MSTIAKATLDFIPSSRRIDRRRCLQRDHAETLLRRAEYLPEHDRLILVAALHDGRSSAEIACLAQSHPSSIRRRLRTLLKRLGSPRFIFVMRQHEHWPPVRRRIAVACELHGLSSRQAAGALGISLHIVRRHRLVIDALFEHSRKEAAA
ncbi:MAG: hypothetical protein KF866_01320 [Phycisphaeraceae bacterium]|nr:hypothetical protein [Phycisphaeraceae bacterium]MCW5755019.1 hypothetical protein [Phycisphaeraceae bacterium]